MDNTQKERVENLMKEMDLILEKSNEEYKSLGEKEITVNNVYKTNHDKIQATKKKLFKKENKLKSKLKKDLKDISNRKYQLIQQFQKSQVVSTEEPVSDNPENNVEYQKYLEKVKLNGGWNLEYVPEEFKTRDMCEVAVANFGLALKYVPEKLITPELCEVAVNDGNWTLEYVPEKFKTQELCELAIEKNGYQLAYVPEHFKTEQLCEMAVKDCGWALEYVPEKFKTLELCKYAIEDCLKWNDTLLRKYEFENLFEKYIPSEFQEQLAQKYDIELPEKSKGKSQEI